MTRVAHRVSAALTCVVLLTVTAAAQKVSFDYDKKADFGALKTFAFKPGARSDNPLFDDRVQSAVAATLASRGMTGVDEDPDVFVTTHLTFDADKDGMGTLVIDVVDAVRGAVIWHGVGVQELKSPPKSSTVDRSITDAVFRILRNYPPNRAKSR